MRNSDIRNNQLTASSGEPGSVLCVVWNKNRSESDDTPTRFSVLDLSECCIQHEHLDVTGVFHVN